MKREIFVGNVGIGGSYPVSIQSMTNAPAHDAGAVLRQIRRLAANGCQIVRVAVPDREALAAFGRVAARSPLPVVADIHFDASLALAAMERGAHAIRINPGNIGSEQKLKSVIREAARRRLPIRIGVNAGSLEKKHRRPGLTTAEAMVNSLADKVRFFEDQGFLDLKLSLKSHDVGETVAANRLADRRFPYPLHLGVTEAGPASSGSIRSAVGIGSLLLDGIGSTIRVSLTADPVREVVVARQILAAAGLSRQGIEIISCPTCARASVDLIPLVAEFERRVARLRPDRRLQVALMGCEVNGPGEARQADVGLAFSRRKAFLFRRGRILGQVPAADALQRLFDLVAETAAAGKHG